MAEKYDAAARLAEGLPSVDTMQTYVQACRMLGYQHPDLTAHAAQVFDWYTGEDGLDLRALDADCAALHTAVAATEDALVRQHDQFGLVTTAWQGFGADASREFLRHHGEAAVVAAAAVRTAANALSDLRDSLWHTVDGKVAAVQAIGDRAQAQADWLAAAQTVTTGAGDRAAASELVDQEVKPFVDNVIGGEWVSAMRAATAAIESAYDAAAAELASEADALFDVPGELGPSWVPSTGGSEVAATVPASAAAPAMTPPAAAAPAGWSQPAAAPPAGAFPPPVDPAAMTPAAAAPPAPSLPAAPSLGGGLPDVGSGLSGFAQQLGDALGGLFGSSGDALSDLPEPSELETPEFDEPDDAEPDDAADDDAELDDDAEPDDAADDDAELDNANAEIADPNAVACEPPGDGPEPQPVEPEPVETPAVEPLAEEPAVTPAPVPPVAGPPPSPPSPASDPGTPCEIAADELPQVGE